MDPCLPQASFVSTQDDVAKRDPRVRKDDESGPWMTGEYMFIFTEHSLCCIILFVSITITSFGR